MSVQAISDALMGEMQRMGAQAAGGTRAASVLDTGSGSGDFASALKASLDKVSGDQTRAVGEAHAFAVGAPNVALNDVMIDSQKAAISFQMAVQVRNKVVSAYTDIMQMQV